MKVDYESISKDILKLSGGKGNISSVTNCITRLRLTIKDIEKVDIEKIKKLNKVNGVVYKGTLQIIFDLGVVYLVREQFDIVYFGKDKLSIAQSSNESSSKIKIKDIKLSTIKDLNLFKRFLSTIQGTFGPLLQLLAGLGILMAIGSILSANGFNDPTSPGGKIDFLPIHIITSMAQKVFDNLGILVGFTAARHFKGNPLYGIALGVFVYHGLPAWPNPGISIGVVELNSGVGGVLGIIAGTYVFITIENYLKKKIPVLMQMLVVPLTTLIVGSLIVTFTILPLFGIIMHGMTIAFEWALGDPSNNIAGNVPQWAIGLVIAPLWPLLVIMGLHWAIIAVLLPILMVTGQMWITPLTMMADAAMLGVGIAVMINSKNKEQRANVASGVASGVAGVTEPIVYGVSLKNPRLYIPVMINAALFGALLGLAEPYANSSVLGIWAFMSLQPNVMGLFVGLFIASIISSAIMSLLMIKCTNNSILDQEDTLSIINKVVKPFNKKQKSNKITEIKLSNKK